MVACSLQGTVSGPPLGLHAHLLMCSNHHLLREELVLWKLTSAQKKTKEPTCALSARDMMRVPFRLATVMETLTGMATRVPVAVPL